MRHNIKGRKLGRTTSHRLATLNALCTSLLQHKRIRTTIAKAKEMRLFVEPMITTAKNAHKLTGDDALTVSKRVHARRQVGRFIKDSDVLKELFTEIAPKVADRPGGYTRVVKLGRRQGDAAEMALIELVDWNDVKAPKAAVSKPRPTRRKAGGSTPQSVEPVMAPTAEVSAPEQSQGEEAPEAK